MAKKNPVALILMGGCGLVSVLLMVAFGAAWYAVDQVGAAPFAGTGDIQGTFGAEGATPADAQSDAALLQARLMEAGAESAEVAASGTELTVSAAGIDAARFEPWLGRRGQLSLMVPASRSVLEAVNLPPEAVLANGEEAILLGSETGLRDAVAGIEAQLPEGHRLVLEVPEGMPVQLRALAPVGAEHHIGSEDVVEAKLGHTEFGPQFELTLSDAAGGRLEAFTRARTGKKIAVVFDGELWSMPIVQEPISGGELRLSVEQLSVAEARAILLNHGPLRRRWRVLTAVIGQPGSR